MKKHLPPGIRVVLVLALFVLNRAPVRAQAQAPDATLQDLLWSQLGVRLQEIARTVDGVFGYTVVDLVTGRTLSLHEDRVFPQASAIKIPILIEVLRQAEAGDLDLRERVTLRKEHQVGGSGVLKTFGDGTTQVSWGDLATLMIVVSDNIATNLIIDRVGMNRVNATLDRMGFRDTRLRRRMIDPAASVRGDENTSTPAEAARLMALLYRGKVVSPEVSQRVLEILKVPKRTPFREGIPTNVELASKPGGLAGVATEWGLVLLPRRPFVLVGMGTYDRDGTARRALTEMARVAYAHFERLARSTRYGVGVPPAYLTPPPSSR